MINLRSLVVKKSIELSPAALHLEVLPRPSQATGSAVLGTASSAVRVLLSRAARRECSSSWTAAGQSLTTERAQKGAARKTILFSVD